MALKRSFSSLDTFSMSSMTDVIFLLLIFFMVTSTLIFPAAIDVNLPQSSEQTSQKPLTEVYVDSLSQFYIVMDRTDSVPGTSTPRAVTRDELISALTLVQQQDSTRGIALYADEKVEYGKIVEILDMAARRKMKMVLATKALQENPAAQEASAK
ncbi:MAG: biopolymer transporter ExbD [Muribaculaceae bacterium]|nr:biopolymer transporter ExbD [Muribaculaceae bacterium]MDE6633107.1 biopolymer transporter ExbD [Muribaculaceae bacterium]